MEIFHLKRMNPVGLMGGIIGALLAWYIGAVVFIPFLIILFTGYLSYRIRKDIDEEIHALSGIHLGHALWTLVGMLIASRFPGLNIFDVIVLTISVALLQWKANIPLLLILIIYQLLALKYTADMLKIMEMGSGIHRAHILHLALRAISLIILIKLLFKRWVSFKTNKAL